MTSPSRNKGNKYEREIVNQAKALGLPAERAYGSNGRALGLSEDTDCLIAGYGIQCKRNDAQPIQKKLRPSANVDAVVTRVNRGESLIIMRYADWLDMVKALGRERNSAKPSH